MIMRRKMIAGLAGLASAGIARPSLGVSSGRVLFKQPSYLDGIAPHFSVTGALPAYNPQGAFYLHANQPNPYRADRAFVPVPWNASTRTGFQVAANRMDWQRGIVTTQNPAGMGHTVAQIHGGTVGAYINSQDLFTGSPGNRMMISAGYQFARQEPIFTGKSSLMGVSLDLQVPTATDGHLASVSNAFAKIDILFVSKKNGVRLSYSCGLFVNGGNPTHDSTGYDDLAHTVIVAAQVSPYGSLVTRRPGSAILQSVPWAGFKTFTFTISEGQFAAGLFSAAPIARLYGAGLSLNPADYVLSTTHLNAEIHYTPQYPSSLGWSMRNLLLTQLA